jgi:hypothetical protein
MVLPTMGRFPQALAAILARALGQVSGAGQIAFVFCCCGMVVVSSTGDLCEKASSTDLANGRYKSRSVVENSSGRYLGHLATADYMGMLPDIEPMSLILRPTSRSPPRTAEPGESAASAK